MDDLADPWAELQRKDDVIKKSTFDKINGDCSSGGYAVKNDAGWGGFDGAARENIWAEENVAGENVDNLSEAYNGIQGSCKHQAGNQEASYTTREQEQLHVSIDATQASLGDTIEGPNASDEFERNAAPVYWVDSREQKLSQLQAAEVPRRGITCPLLDSDSALIDQLFQLPAAPKTFDFKEPDEIISSISARKAWYRIRRSESLREFNRGDTEKGYVRIAWSTSAIRQNVLNIVSRWQMEDRVQSQTLLGIGSRPATAFCWDVHSPTSSRSTQVVLQLPVQQDPMPPIAGFKGPISPAPPAQRSMDASRSLASFSWSSPTASTVSLFLPLQDGDTRNAIKSFSIIADPLDTSQKGYPSVTLQLESGHQPRQKAPSESSYPEEPPAQSLLPLYDAAESETFDQNTWRAKSLGSQHQAMSSQDQYDRPGRLSSMKSRKSAGTDLNSFPTYEETVRFRERNPSRSREDPSGDTAAVRTILLTVPDLRYMLW